MDSLTGKLLIAVPQLPDENFFRTVVLVLRHDDQGALGVILNRPTEVSLSKIWENISNESTDLNEPIYFGGPVQGPIMAIHGHFSVAEDTVLPGIFFSVRREQLNELVADKKLPFKVFTGHSGWGAGQLELEIESGGWFLVNATHEHIFNDPDDLWKRVCEQFGNEMLIDLKFCSKVPSDPTLN